jgi:hypothetical protein
MLDNPLLREILSDPSGNIPDGIVEYDTESVEYSSEKSGKYRKDDLHDLGDLFN